MLLSSPSRFIITVNIASIRNYFLTLLPLTEKVGKSLILVNEAVDPWCSYINIRDHPWVFKFTQEYAVTPFSAAKRNVISAVADRLSAFVLPHFEQNVRPRSSVAASSVKFPKIFLFPEVPI